MTPPAPMTGSPTNAATRLSSSSRTRLRSPIVVRDLGHVTDERPVAVADGRIPESDVPYGFVP